MSHPQTELRSRSTVGSGLPNEKDSLNSSRKPRNFSDEEPLLDAEAILCKHELMEQQAVEIELEKTSLTSSQKERLKFRDGVRLIDYVLVFETPAEGTKLDEDDQKKEEENEEKRRLFEAHLKEAGLELEYEDGISTKVQFPDLLNSYNHVYIYNSTCPFSILHFLSIPSNLHTK